LGWQAGLIVAGLSILAGWIFAYAETNGLIVSSMDASFEIAAEITAIFGLAAIILALTTAGLSNALHRARSSEEAATESNRNLRALSESLELQVAARTRRLEIVAALSERLSAILDVDQLLNEVVNQIKNSLDYYHAHIYLLDDRRENLVMMAGTGPAGAEMKARGHHISLQAATSLVVRSARTSQVVTIDNVRESSDWLPNPLLPDTYSEMAVPIVLDQEVVGVLDVQEDRIAGLDDGDAGLLRSLANQVAVTIRNARLFAEVETALHEAREAQKRYVQESWQKVDRIEDVRHVFLQSDIGISDEEQRQIMLEARKQAVAQERPVVVDADSGDGKSLVTPISLRDKTIGVIKIQTADENRAWDEDDLTMVETIAEQVAQTAENLRLFDETRQRADYERLVGEVTQKIRQAPDLETLSKIATEAISEVLDVSHGGVSFDLASAQPQTEKGNGHV
jgi:GAF domain-containing protein